MKVIDVNLMPLPSKHYSTDVWVTVSVEGHEYSLLVSVAGYAPKASSREIERGWEPDWGMDHTESEAHLDIAQRVVTALAALKGQRDE
jgi:hypothetical protein